MKVNSVITLLLCALVLFSCKKEPLQYVFKGKISENQSHGSLSGVDVKMFQIPFSNTVTSNIYELAASSTTNSSGDYDMSFERKKVTEFKLSLSKSGYFDADIDVNPSDVSASDDNLVDYEMEAKSWLRFTVQNAGLASNSDNLTLILFNYRQDCAGCASADYNYFPGIVDTTFKYTSTAGQYFRFHYAIQGGQSLMDSVYMTPFDTVAYSIIY